jgi:hypothetical protein
MRKSIIVAILITLLTLAGTAGSALAAYSSATVIVSPGSRVCLNPQYAGYKVRAEGLSNQGVRFTVHRSATGGTYQDIYQSTDNTTAFAAEFNSTFQPYYFPGYFKVCARNLGTSGATVTLTIKTDADAP